MAKKASAKKVETLEHTNDRRANILIPRMGPVAGGSVFRT